MEDLPGSVLAARAALGDGAWPAVLQVVAHAHTLAPAPPAATADLLAPWAEPGAADELGRVHESMKAGRQASGTFYTPPPLVEWVLDQALEPLLAAGQVPQVLDPACGAGAFLVAVVRRVASRLGVPAAVVVPHVHGTDLDPVGVAISRLLLRIAAPQADPTPTVRVADGLGVHPAAPYDAVVGNPPFLGRLRRRPADAPRGPGAYTDTSALFLQHALGLVRPGGRVGLVQPLSVLAARDAAPVRRAAAVAGAVTAFWSSSTPVFAGAEVRTCAVVVEAGAEQGPVHTWHGPGLTRGEDLELPAPEWGPLAAPAFGVPSVRLSSDGTLGDVATCTADFRDQYYGLVPFVREAGESFAGAPLVTSGLIDPAACRWGERPARFAGTRYAAPSVDLDALRAAPGAHTLAAWAEARLVPKLLVATQGRVIEAVADVHGAWLPSVPVLTVVPEPDLIWHVLAVLLAPPVTALAAGRYLGTALSATSIKLSARQVAALPLPLDRGLWDDGAALARTAQTGPDADRTAALRSCAEVMGRAYDEPGALVWWLERART